MPGGHIQNLKANAEEKFILCIGNSNLNKNLTFLKAKLFRGILKLRVYEKRSCSIIRVGPSICTFVRNG